MSSTSPCALTRGGAGSGARWARSAQDGEGKGALVQARGADLLFLPSYSPELKNPIEEAFSKIKALVRKEGVRVCARR